MEEINVTIKMEIEILFDCFLEDGNKIKLNLANVSILFKALNDILKFLYTNM